jgi:DeoR family transcriptional regulator, fructose operon transcriptional repressor
VFPEKRKQQILELLASDGSVTVSDLSSLLGVSTVSIRRDLRDLQAAGLLKRTHGGAMTGHIAAFEPSEAEKEDQLREEKVAIAEVAAAMVQEGETVLLDAGSTTLQIAKLLKSRRDLAVITNALNVAAELASGEAETTLIGGSLRTKTLSLVGPVAESTLASLYVDRLFLAANGIDLKRGLTTPNVLEAHTKRTMVKSARAVIVVADHTKFGRVTVSQFCEIGEIHCLITDSGAPADFVSAMEKRGVRVILADGRPRER